MRVAFVILFITAVAGFLVVALAPGNWNRHEMFQDQVESKGSVAQNTVAILLDVTQVHLMDWLFDPRLLLAGGLLFLIVKGESRPSWMASQDLTWRWLIPLLTVAIPVCCLLTFLVGSSGAYPPQRILRLMYFLYVIGFFCTVLAWLPQRNAEPSHPDRRGERMANAAMLLLAISLVATGNGRTALVDATKRLGGWKRQTEARLATLRNAQKQGISSVPLDPIVEIPRPYIQRDLDSDPDNWYNTSFAHYFGVEKVWIPNPVYHRVN